MNRSEMLHSIRTALGRKERDQEDEFWTQTVQERNYALNPDLMLPSIKSANNELHLLFTEKAQNNGTTILPVHEKKTIPQVLNRYLKEISADKHTLHCMDAEILNLPWTSVGIEIDTGLYSPKDKIGISTAFAGVAETGSVMLVSSASNPSSAAFLPETHVVLLKQHQIFETIEEAFASLLDFFNGKALPRSVHLISGASKTGDIGGKIVDGAHGPLRFVIVLETSELPTLETD